MNAEENFDLALLRLLDSNGSSFGLGPIAISHLIGQFGVTGDLDKIKVRLRYLQDLNMVATVEKGNFHPENATWRITAIGTNHLREHGL